MFYFKNIRRHCFYTKIYENIKIVRDLKVKSKRDGLLENANKNQHNNIRDKKIIDNTISREDTEFYKNVYSKLKGKKGEHVQEKTDRQESSTNNDKENAINHFKEVEKNDRTSSKNKYLISKRDAINSQHIPSNTKYLKRREIYLKYKDGNSSQKKLNKEAANLRDGHEQSCKKRVETLEKKDNELVNSNGNDMQIYNEGQNEKKVIQKNCKSSECNFEGSALNKEKNKNSYVLVKYEKYWDMDKINKFVELEDDSNAKNKVFKGVLFVSPFDTSKSFVVEEKVGSENSKIKYYNVYGYISRNRALNNDIVYAYTGRRKIIKTSKVEQNENENDNENTNENDDVTNKMKEDENSCRVVNVLERKNAEIVCNLNYLNVKEYINNLFEVKKELNMLTDQEKRENNEKAFAKFQPTDARLPCFIYDSSDEITNRILNYIKKKKKNLYVLVNYRKWEENEINPTGDIISILGNEQNFFSIIYFFLHFYKVNFHIYKEDDMNYLNSEITIGNKLINSFIERKNKCVGGGTKYDWLFKTKEKDYLSIEFEKKINYLKEMQEKNKKIEKYMIKSLLTDREILTHLDVFTIDPPTAKDLDDALSIQFIRPDQFSNIKYKYKVGVHISDVSFFIPPNSYYDKVAATQCNTLYMDLMVLHMLPSVISENICSLNTSGNKLSFSVFFNIDDMSNPYEIIKEKNSENVEMKKGIIKSRYKLCYDIVEDYIDEVYTCIDELEKKKDTVRIEKDYVKEWEENILINGDTNLDCLFPEFKEICIKYNLSIKIASDIFRLYLLSKRIKNKIGRKTISHDESLMFFLNNKREMNKMVPVSIDYVKSCLKNEIVCDKTNKDEETFESMLGNVMQKMNAEDVEVKIIKNKIKSHMLIEEMMILSNFLVANKICECNNLGILRTHEDSSDEIKNNLLQFIDYHTYNKINKIINIKENNLNNILLVCEKVLDKNSFLCLQYNVLKFYKQAVYVPNIEKNENAHHFGLSLNNYIHFTSPIRRYIDIITHRILNNILEKKQPLYNYEQIKKICELCNTQKKKADDIQIHMKNFFLNKYLVCLNEEYKSKMIKESSFKMRKKKKSERIQNDATILSNSIDNSQIVNEANNLDLKMDKAMNEHKAELYKNNFYIYKNVISFMTHSYIHDIIVKKSIKRNICMNILNCNYINVDEDGIINEMNCPDSTYTCLVPILLSSDKTMEEEHDEVTKIEYTSSICDEKKMKNAISFYVPLLETEKSVSENLLDLKFELISISSKEGTFVYNTSLDVLYKINLKKNNENVSNSSWEKEEYEEDRLKNECLNHIYKNILNIKIKVQYKVLKLEKNEIKKNFQNIYDNLYVHGIYAKQVDNTDKLKKTESLTCEKVFNEMDDHKEVSNNFNDEQSISTKEDNYLSNMEKENVFNQYKEINRFQKNEIFLIPGAKMWNLRFA
ncbi:exoribonuclease II, putative [Plasmodium vinckei lentum]|uniref:Exoribonuclease II, putative n=1 Tax=Plasmodium vinckei lentum TaxID=138297 RepID=A0A6V7RVZ8_PLAVN|nr:exoribonuclease II, putative [Plasmodium vinckei lentum]